jgi:hypothetical protein
MEAINAKRERWSTFVFPAGPNGIARISGDADFVTVRVSYKFGGPIVAKY